MNALRQLPEQVSAVAADLAVLRADVTRFRVDVRAEFTSEFAAVRQEIRTGDEETRRMMRILHEEVISRIALLGEKRKTRRHRKR